MVVSEPGGDKNSTRETKPQTILLVDDHELVRAGIRLLIQSVVPQAHLIEASTGEESIELLKANKIDLVFMDVILPGIDGLSAALQMISLVPSIKVLILTGQSKLAIPGAFKNAGVSGFITKSSAADEISSAISAAAKGEFFLSSDLHGLYATAEPDSPESPFDNLSGRELQVVLLLIGGVKTSDAGDSLALDARTVSTYKRRAFAKLGVDNTADLIKLAIQYDLSGY